jgi:2-dehydropantoate 2-reductase
MCVDLLNKRRTEIDFINGAVVRLGRTYGIPTPVNKALVAVVKGLERNFT